MKYNSLIIIPTYNEAENIEAVIKKVMDLEDKNDILVIDDKIKQHQYCNHNIYNIVFVEYKLKFRAYKHS